MNGPGLVNMFQTTVNWKVTNSLFVSFCSDFPVDPLTSVILYDVCIFYYVPYIYQYMLGIFMSHKSMHEVSHVPAQYK